MVTFWRFIREKNIVQETEVKFKIDQQEYEFDWENNNIIREIIPFGSIDNDQLLDRKSVV